ncbi:MAG: MBL fold metallo-hydrolase [Desulfomonilaceae bacterium]
MDYSILLPGVPVSSERGALGWCSVTIIRHGDRNILVDTGSYGDRTALLNALETQGLTPNQINDVFISHLHYDHFLNVDLFSKARIWVPMRDLTYVMEQEYLHCNDPYVPATVVHYFADRLTSYVPDQIIAEGLLAIGLPGHTPGTSGLYDENSRILFAGDGVKNAWEFVNRVPPPAFFDAERAVANYQKVSELVDIVVPGHDCPFRITPDGGAKYLQSYTPVIKFYPGRDQNAKMIRIE